MTTTPAFINVISQKIQQRNAREIDPYQSLIDSHQKLQFLSRAKKDEISSLKAQVAKLKTEKADAEKLAETYKDASASIAVPAARMKKLEDQNEQLHKALSARNSVHELEHKTQELSIENRKLRDSLEEMRQERDENATRAKEREEMVVILRQEYEALKSENASNRVIYQSAQDDYARLEPMVLKGKQREAELMDQILALESELCDLRHRKGDDLESVVQPNAGKAAQFVDSMDTASFASKGCVAPSYIAHQTDDAHEGAIDAVAMTENSRHFWTGGTDKMLKCWETSNGQPVNKVPSIAAVMCLDSVADLMVAGCVDSTCRIYELGTLRGRCQLTGHQEKVTAAYFSSDGHRVYSASSDRTIKTWDVSRGSLAHTSMCFSACNDICVVNDRICSAHFDTTLRFWDARTGKESGDIPGLHDRTITSVRLTQDGNTAVSLSRDNTVKVSDVRTLRLLSTLTSDKLHVARNHARVAISPDGHLVGCGTSSGAVLVWNVNGPLSEPTILSKGHSSNVPCVSWSPDGRGLVSVGDKRVVFWR